MGYEGDTKVHVVPRSLKKFAVTMKKWMKRRSAVEACIGHIKRDNRMNRNYLSGVEGDRMNAILGACGHNMRLLLASLLLYLFRISIILRNKPLNLAYEV